MKQNTLNTYMKFTTNSIIGGAITTLVGVQILNSFLDDIQLIPIISGPNLRIRALNIFKKNKIFPSKDEVKE